MASHELQRTGRVRVAVVGGADALRGSFTSMTSGFRVLPFPVEILKLGSERSMGPEQPDTHGREADDCAGDQRRLGDVPAEKMKHGREDPPQAHGSEVCAGRLFPCGLIALKGITSQAPHE